MKPTGLGKGLSAIFETESQNSPKMGSTGQEIALSNIEVNPNQPRTAFDQEALAELAESIRRLGVIQPITIRERGAGKYQIVSGERRFRAAKMAGLTTIPAYVRIVGDEQLLEMALVENIQREELDAIEIALSLERLTSELGLTQDALSQSVGKRRSTIANYLRLLTIAQDVQAAVKARTITMGHARAIASIEDHAVQCDILARVIKGGLSVRVTEALVKTPQKPTRAPKANMTEWSSRLIKALPVRKAKVEVNEKGTGKITLSFANEKELRTIIEKIEGQNQ